MKIALIGYGKMGQKIHSLLSEDSFHEVVVIRSSDELPLLKSEEVEVAIEFTTPESAFHNLSVCIKEGVPVVSGTTGWLDKMKEIEDLCRDKDGAFLYASNFSIGVNVFFAINKRLGELMNSFRQYECSIHEIHHITKKDAPSGTSITLAEDLIAVNQNYKSWKHEPGGGQVDSLRISSDRIKDAPGTHIIKYTSAIDDITIAHEAKSREGFARGAILAAEWIQGKKGFFSMNDVLGIN